MKQTLLLLVLAACGDDRYVLVEVAQSGGWIIDGGSIDTKDPNVFVMYPQPLTIRFGIESVVDHDPTKLATRNGTATLYSTFSGIGCEISAGPTCEGTTCTTDLAILGESVCMVRIRAETADGEPHGACWYRATFGSADPVMLEAQIHDRLASDYQGCLDSFDANSL